ncbi:transport and Golgi organization protein 11-like [Rhagoletis pomonella]|uniref:transport and Golgi organization protein 11-like n=1 Tax=Rhagoletis pomonella TaxID=28610 RepID=UPI001781A0FA|nr:transport and Golgi organization protein 11-like [Rhagoletis pomonella]
MELEGRGKLLHCFIINIYDNGGDFEDGDYDEDVETRPPPYVRANGVSHAQDGFHPADSNSVESDSQLTTGGGSKRSQQLVYNNNTDQCNDTSIVSHREGTPIGELTPHEEILYLRRQLAKLNRRVLNIEINNEQRLQREKIVYCLGLAYFVLKAVFWLNRNWSLCNI